MFSIKKGQVLLITVFTLTFALLSLFLLLASIRDKLIKIKDLENIYQAIANGEKGLESSLLYEFTQGDKNLSLDISKSISENSLGCAGLTFNGAFGTCVVFHYFPQGQLWTKNDLFIADNYIFIVTMPNGETSFKMKNVADGIMGRISRTILIGSGK